MTDLPEEAIKAAMSVEIVDWLAEPLHLTEDEARGILIAAAPIIRADERRRIAERGGQMSETVIWDSVTDYAPPRYRVETLESTFSEVGPRTWVSHCLTNDLDEALGEAERLAYNGGRVRVVEIGRNG